VDVLPHLMLLTKSIIVGPVVMYSAQDA